jgi:hypothetical protein
MVVERRCYTKVYSLEHLITITATAQLPELIVLLLLINPHYLFIGRADSFQTGVQPRPGKQGI